MKIPHTLGAIIVSAWVAGCFFLLCGTAMANDADIRIGLGEQPFYIGEGMPFSFVVTNRASRGGISFDHQRGDADRKFSGIAFILTHLADGRRLPQRHGLDPRYSTIGPNASEELCGDLASLFAITNTGRYRLQVRILNYLYLVDEVNGKEVCEIKTKVDVQSPPVEFEVKGVDPEQAAQIERLLKSDVRDENTKGVSLLESASPELFRRSVRTLLPLLRAEDDKRRIPALKLFFARVELSDVLSDDELFNVLDFASREKDPDVRLTAAQSLLKFRSLQPRWKLLSRFTVQRLPEWFERETSAACRAVLVSEIPTPMPDTLIAIVQCDSDPQVRVAAVRRMIDQQPQLFLKTFGSFTNLSVHVEIGGQKQSFGTFLENEKIRVQRFLGVNGQQDTIPK